MSASVRLYSDREITKEDFIMGLKSLWNKVVNNVGGFNDDDYENDDDYVEKMKWKKHSRLVAPLQRLVVLP